MRKSEKKNILEYYDLKTKTVKKSETLTDDFMERTFQLFQPEDDVLVKLYFGKEKRRGDLDCNIRGRSMGLSGRIVGLATTPD